MICECAECGKVFDVLYPQLWVYKSNGAYYCTYRCIRKMDNRGDEKYLKSKGLTLEDKKKAVEIALEGGNPLEYLRGLGAKDPTQTWFGIKSKLKDSNPEIYAKLPKRIQTKPVEYPKPMEKVITVNSEPPKAPAVIGFDAEKYKVCCLEHKAYGRFYWDRDQNHLDWTTFDGEEVSFTPTGWKGFIETLTEVMGLLGVEQ